MSDEEDVTFSLKAVINKQKNKVLFVEIENDLANVLLGFMALPLGRIVQVFGKHYGENTPVIGSLTTLYNGVANLDSSHFQSYDKKQMLLDPKSSYLSPFRNMNLSFFDSEPTDFHLWKARTGNFIECSASFIVSDNLQMMDNMSMSLGDSLKYVDLDMEDLDGAEIRTVKFGVNQIMDLLKGSFISRHPLTDIILGTKRMTPQNSEDGIPLHDLIEKEPTKSDPKKMSLKLVFEKSSKKFLFAEAGQDFVDLLFSMLTIPLGVVEGLVESEPTLYNINNLYGSITEMSSHIFAADTKEWLLGNINPHSLFTSKEDQRPIFVDFRSRMYIVFDDLTVTPFSVCSTLSLLNQINISPSHVKELELQLDLEER